MVFHYDPETDSLYIDLSDQPSVESREVIEEQMVLDFDEKGRVVGIDIEDASQILDLAFLAKVGVLVNMQPNLVEAGVRFSQDVAAGGYDS